MNRLVLFLIAASLGTGCATLTAPKMEALNVTSEPPGAQVLVNGAPVGQTPVVVQLDKQRLQQIQVAAPGFAPQFCRPIFTPGGMYVVSDVLICAVLFPIGCLAFVDAGGAWNTLQFPSCNVNLSAGDPSVGYPPQGYPPQAYPPPPPGNYPPPPPGNYPPPPPGNYPQ